MESPIQTFFLQAEDGIRGLYVTGVQTCALPISELSPRRSHEPQIDEQHDQRRQRQDRLRHCQLEYLEIIHNRLNEPERRTGVRRDNQARKTKIGRASCRERVEDVRDVDQYEEKQ